MYAKAYMHIPHTIAASAHTYLLSGTPHIYTVRFNYISISGAEGGGRLVLIECDRLETPRTVAALMYIADEMIIYHLIYHLRLIYDLYYSLSDVYYLLL